MAVGRGKPRTKDAASGQHGYSGEESLSYWQRAWKAEIDKQPPPKRRETIERATWLMERTHYRSGLHQLAMCYQDDGGDGDGECIRD